MRSLADSYRGSVQCTEQEDWVREERTTRRRTRGRIHCCPSSSFIDDDALGHNRADRSDDKEDDQDNRDDGSHQLSLTLTLFWYDNTHVCKTSHYRDFVFEPKNHMVARGGFVEDKTSPAIVRNVERLGLREGHSRFGCYLLDDHSGYFFTGHLDGGSYMTREGKIRFEEERKRLGGGGGGGEREEGGRLRSAGFR